MNCSSTSIRHLMQLLCTALFVQLAVSCERVPSLTEPDSPIRFCGGRSADAVLSRSGTPLHAEFTVIGYRHPDDLAEASPATWAIRPLFVEKYTSQGTPLATGGSYYYDWASFYNFLAYTPHARDGVIVPSVLAWNDPFTPVVPSLTFVTPPLADVDLMHAKETVYLGSFETVPLLFNHTLTRIRFSGKGDETLPDMVCKILGIKYTVSKTTNTLCFAQSEPRMQPVDATGTPHTFALKDVQPTELSKTEFLPVRVGNTDKAIAELYVVPQVLDKYAAIELTYEIDTVERTIIFPLPAGTSLEGGTSVDYQFAISKAKVTILPDGSEEWEDVILDNGTVPGNVVITFRVTNWVDVTLDNGEVGVIE